MRWWLRWGTFLSTDTRNDFMVRQHQWPHWPGCSKNSSLWHVVIKIGLTYKNLPFYHGLLWSQFFLLASVHRFTKFQFQLPSPQPNPNLSTQCPILYKCTYVLGKYFDHRLGILWDRTPTHTVLFLPHYCLHYCSAVRSGSLHMRYVAVLPSLTEMTRSKGRIENVW